MAEDVSSSTLSLLAQLARKYIWWDRDALGSVPQRRIMAQVMNLGTYDDVLALLAAVGEKPFVDVLQHPEPGWFAPRSWTYWHYRLGLTQPNEAIPELPHRTFS